MRRRRRSNPNRSASPAQTPPTTRPSVHPGRSSERIRASGGLRRRRQGRSPELSADGKRKPGTVVSSQSTSRRFRESSARSSHSPHDAAPYYRARRHRSRLSRSPPVAWACHCARLPTEAQRPSTDLGPEVRGADPLATRCSTPAAAALHCPHRRMFRTRPGRATAGYGGCAQASRSTELDAV